MVLKLYVTFLNRHAYLCREKITAEEIRQMMLKMDLMVGEKRDDGVKEDLERVVEREGADDSGNP